jgi:hypothetical protein
MNLNLTREISFHFKLSRFNNFESFFSHISVIFEVHNKDIEGEVSQMVVFLLLIVIAVIYFNTGGKTSQYFNQNNKSPEELLKERFVKGEIDEITYLNMKQIIVK